jgi:hypothetical protein
MRPQLMLYRHAGFGRSLNWSGRNSLGEFWVYWERDEDGKTVSYAWGYKLRNGEMFKIQARNHVEAVAAMSRWYGKPAILKTI